MKTLRIPKGIFNAVCYTPDGRHLLGLHSGWRLRVWATADLSERYVGRLPGTLYSHDYVGLCGHLAVMSERVYDARDLWSALEQPAGLLRDHGLLREVDLGEPGPQHGRCFYVSNGLVVLRVDDDWLSRSSHLSYWDTNGRPLRKETLPTRMWHAPALSADGRALACCLSSNSVRLSGPGEGTSVDLQHTDHTRLAAFSPDGRHLATASGRSLWLWDVEKARGERFVAFQKYVDALAFHPEGHTLAAADRAGEIRLVQIPSGRQLASLNFGVGGIAGLAFSPDGMTVAGAGRNNAVVIWDVE